MTAAPSIDSSNEHAEALRQRLLDLIVLDRLTVPLLPQVASEVLRLSTEDGSSAAALSSLVHKDPALAARIVRLANSSAYAPRTPITSVQQAIVRIGVTALRETVLSTSIESGVFRVPGFERELQSLWRHALACACYAKKLARARSLDVDHFFLCGLLHGIGSPVLLQKGLDEAAGVGMVVKGGRGRLVLFGIASELGPLAGATVTTAWKLPGAVVACARHHLDPLAAREHVNDCAVVFIARQLAARALAPDGAAEVVTPEHGAFARVGINTPILQDLLAQGPAVRSEVDALTG